MQEQCLVNIVRFFDIFIKRMYSLAGCYTNFCSIAFLTREAVLFAPNLRRRYL